MYIHVRVATCMYLKISGKAYIIHAELGLMYRMNMHARELQGGELVLHSSQGEELVSHSQTLSRGESRSQTLSGEELVSRSQTLSGGELVSRSQTLSGEES